MAIDTAPSSTGVLLSSDDKGSPIPTVFFDMITLDDAVTNPNYIGEFHESNLVINLKMNIEIPLDAFDEDILNNLSVCVSRCVSKESAKKIQLTGKIGKDQVTKIYQGPLKSLLKGADLDVIGAQKESVYETSSGKGIFNLSFQKQDKISTSRKMPHLSYYAFCYLNLENMIKSLGITDIPNLPPTLGPISGESVISGGEVNTTSYVYYITSPFPENISGTYWTGPIIQDENGKYSAARWIGSQIPRLIPSRPKIDLEKIEVRNSKIQDYRFVKQIPSFNFDLIPSKFLPITIKGNDNFNNSIQNPDAYISNAFLTRDMHNNCRFMFEFDFNRALIKESKFGKILTNPFVPEETKRKIYTYSPITNLKIKRRKVETARSFNRLSSPILGINTTEANEEPKLIVETSSNLERSNMLRKKNSFAPGTGRGDLMEQVGSIMEIQSLKGSPKKTRTIAVTDKSASQLQNGTYQYGVEIEMEDGSIRFLNERLRRLGQLRTYLKEYYDLKQIPRKNYQTITGIMDYYDIIFSTSAGLRSRRRGPRTDFNRASFSIKREINNLRTELGFLIGKLDSRETLYPWVIVPEYLVDTLEAISDFSYITKSRDIAATQTIQTPTAILEPPDDTPPEILGRTTGLSRPNEVDSGARDYGIEANQGVSLDSFDRIDSDPSAPTAAQMRAIDLFDEKTARFSLRTLLDPRSATSESILQVIGVLDMVTQKVRTMMGSSAQMEELNLSTKQRGVSKNFKVSVLSLKDHFIELFDARLSPMPAVDYVGFRNSTGFIPPVTQGEFETEVQGGTQYNALDDALATQGGDAGLQGMEADDYETKLEDEEAIDDTIDQGELDRLAAEAAQAEAEANAAEAAAAAADEEEEDAAAARAAQARAKAIAKAKAAAEAQEALEKEREQDLANTSGSKKNKNKKRRMRRKKKLRQKQNQQAQDRDAPPDAPERDPEGDPLLLTGTVFNNKHGTELLVTGETMPTIEDFRSFQNNTVAANSGKIPSGTSQDTINTMMTNINVVVNQNKTPLSAQDFLTTTQAAAVSSVSVASILGATDGQVNGSIDSQINTCTPGLDGGDRSVDLERCKNETNAQGMFQTMMNMFADNGSLSQIFERAQGNASMLKKLYQKKKNQKQTGAGDSARDNLLYGKMVKVTVFMGYETDRDGNFMIKRPIFKSPPNWEQLIRSVKNQRDSNDVILCRIEANPLAPLGLQMVETNSYFLITKDKKTLVNQEPTKDPKLVSSAQSARDRIEKIARERDIPPKALISLYIEKKGGSL